MPKRDDRTEYEKLPKRVRVLIEHCRSGKTLCRGYRPRAIGYEDQVVSYWLEPGGKAAPTISSQQAIDKGYLKPLDTGLFGDGNAQSYGAVSDHA